MATTDKSSKSTSLSSQGSKKRKSDVISTGMSVSSFVLKMKSLEPLDTIRRNRFENALFYTLHKINGQIMENNKIESTKSFLDRITGSKKILLNKALGIVEEVPDPVYLYSSDENTTLPEHDILYIEGLLPDVAWKLQNLLDQWNTADPSLFPKVKLSIYNMRLQFQNPHLTKLFEFLESILEFDSILSLRDILPKSVLQQLDTDKLIVSLFKNHLEVYVKKEFTELGTIEFERPNQSIDDTTETGGFMISNTESLGKICQVIKHNFHSIVDAILIRGVEMGFDKELSTKINDHFTISFGIAPVITNSEAEHLNSISERVYNKIVNADSDKINIECDLDVLHYLRSLCENRISLEELIAGSTCLEHVSQLKDRSLDEEVDMDTYNRAKSSGKPIIQTQYFLRNYDKFYITELDLSQIRLVKQPELDIVAHLQHLNSLDLSNNRTSGKYNPLELEFGKLPQLKLLKLRKCGINRLSKSMFQKTSNLEKVYAEGNTIMEIEGDCFEGSGIKELHVDQLKNRKYPRSIVSLIESSKELQRARKYSLVHSFSNS
ncbi:MAG: hypothetical protein ACXAD7_23535 [Candidatus Kariarchaeaceae archaeon]|jgi:Leucine-rich repeat (LRR) protein